MEYRWRVYVDVTNQIVNKLWEAEEDNKNEL